ncbi:MAG: radical SAM protein [Smithellaceae bacterium]
MNILLMTPPCTQLNTPYPATSCLKGFLKTQGYDVHQADLGIELVCRLFTGKSLQNIFAESKKFAVSHKSSANVRLIYANRQRYIETVEPVMRFLRNEDPTLAARICTETFLPKGSRFGQPADLDWAFGAMGISDQARHLATLFIEDLADYIRDAVCPNFELSRYGEKLCLYLPEFDPLEAALSAPLNQVDKIMLAILDEKMQQWKPDVIGVTIPFPGNLYGALKCGQFLKSRYPDCKIVLGGGYVNTEWRALQEKRIFNYCDFILFDDGEPSLLALLGHLEGKRDRKDLIRTCLKAADGSIQFIQPDADCRIPFAETGTPDYSDLLLDQYLSMIELTNPMHKLWSDGRWNKLTLARGCYWAKCAFCDTSLPYIACYDPADARLSVDRIESIVRQTGQTGFHFTDEAAPPKVLRELSEEILRRKLTVSWWTNIRFEKAFTPELCALMARAGCIAVSGGIEVASDRILKLINKGITLAQAAKTTHHLTRNDIMVHAYLMYGFPTETAQETIDSLEVIRQMFNEGLIQSAFWHRYAMTLHSPTGRHPEKYGARRYSKKSAPFANNEIPFTDGQDIDLDTLGEGLRKATYNYMHGLGFDWPVFRWFDRTVPKTTLKPALIKKLLA